MHRHPYVHALAGHATALRDNAPDELMSISHRLATMGCTLLAASGLSSPEIAEQLTIAVRTVDNHLHRVYTKLGVEGRNQLSELI